MAKTAYQLRFLPDESIKAINPQYEVEIVQEPFQARACGSAKSFSGRRSIDPPPIVKVSLLTNQQRDVVDHTYNFLFMTATAEVIDQNVEDLGSAASKKNFKKRKPNLEKNKNHLVFGTTTTSANIITNGALGDDGLKAFFVFNDISVRYEGYYRLNFRLFEFPLSRAEHSTNRAGVIYRGGIKSNIFKVYNAKYFPGLSASPQLTLTLKNMGSRIRVRKPNKRDDLLPINSSYDKSLKLDGDSKSGDFSNMATNLKVLSEISSALRQLPQGKDQKTNGRQTDAHQQSQPYPYYNTPGYGYNINNQFYVYNYIPGTSPYDPAIQNNKPGSGYPSPNVVADATQTASAAVSQQQRELQAVKHADDENIDDEFKTKPVETETTNVESVEVVDPTEVIQVAEAANAVKDVEVSETEVALKSAAKPEDTENVDVNENDDAFHTTMSDGGNEKSLSNSNEKKPKPVLDQS